MSDSKFDNLFLALQFGKHAPGTRFTAEMLEGTGWKLEELIANKTVIYVPLTVPEDANLVLVPAPGEKPVTSSMWAFDPATLQGVPLDALNILALEHAATYGHEEPPEFETIEEALAFLSKDR